MSNVKGLEEFTDAKSMRAWQNDWHSTLMAQVRRVIDAIYDFAKHSQSTEMRFPPDMDEDVIKELQSLGYTVRKFYSGDKNDYIQVSW